MPSIPGFAKDSALRVPLRMWLGFDQRRKYLALRKEQTEKWPTAVEGI